MEQLQVELSIRGMISCLNACRCGILRAFDGRVLNRAREANMGESRSREVRVVGIENTLWFLRQRGGGSASVTGTLRRCIGAYLW